MSIRPIDSQMMIARAAELAKDTAPILRQGEIAQSYHSLHAKELAAQERQTIAKSNESEKTELHPDKEGDSPSYFGSPDGRKEERKEENAMGTLLVPPDPNGGHKIDIMI